MGLTKNYKIKDNVNGRNERNGRIMYHIVVLLRLRLLLLTPFSLFLIPTTYVCSMNGNTFHSVGQRRILLIYVEWDRFTIIISFVNMDHRLQIFFAASERTWNFILFYVFYYRCMYTYTAELIRVRIAMPNSNNYYYNRATFPFRNIREFQ